MTILFIGLIAFIIFVLLFWVKKENKLFHISLVGACAVYLFVDYLQMPNNDKSFTLLLLLVLVGNAFQNFKKAA